MPPKSTGVSTASFKAQYQAVLDQRQRQFDQHFVNPNLETLHRSAHVRLLEIEKVYALVQSRREHRLLELAYKLLADGLCQVACANYTLAFFGLRSFLELSTAAVRFSAYEFELREWELGKRDILWGALVNTETGVSVYGKTFASSFFAPLAEETRHYQGLAQRTYRECSQYVHANPGSHSSGQLEVERSKFWFELFDSAATCVLFLFLVRYHSEIGSAIASDDDAKAIFLTELGHFDGVSTAIETGVVQ